MKIKLGKIEKEIGVQPNFIKEAREIQLMQSVKTIASKKLNKEVCFK